MNNKRILVSNDDGINAPGLQALVAELVRQDFCTVCVCGPSGEQSGQSHAITLGKPLACFPIIVPGAQQSFAVVGSPADSVMLALNGPIFEDPAFDLVISGINRGDNCGLHVIYSGTVGAAREAACKGVPSLAVSLDNVRGKSIEEYAAASIYTVALVKAVLGLLEGTEAAWLKEMIGCVINVNVPAGPLHAIKGLHLTHQGAACVFPAFREVFQEVPHDEGAVTSSVISMPGMRTFRNAAGDMRWDDSPGSDTWAVHEGWASVTPLGLRSDIALHQGKEKEVGAYDVNGAFPELLSAMVKAAAKTLGVTAQGCSRL